MRKMKKRLTILGLGLLCGVRGGPQVSLPLASNPYRQYTRDDYGETFKMKSWPSLDSISTPENAYCDLDDLKQIVGLKQRLETLESTNKQANLVRQELEKKLEVSELGRQADQAEQKELFEKMLEEARIMRQEAEKREQAAREEIALREKAMDAEAARREKIMQEEAARREAEFVRREEEMNKKMEEDRKAQMQFMQMFAQQMKALSRASLAPSQIGSPRGIEENSPVASARGSDDSWLVP